MNQTQIFTTPSIFFRGQRELAQFLGVDAVTIRRLVRRKALPAIRLGRNYLFKRADVEEFLEAHTLRAIGTPRARKTHGKED